MSAAASLVARRLTYAINAACAARGDSEANRLALLEEVSGLPHDVQRGFAEHFELIYAGLRPLPASGTGSSLGDPCASSSHPDFYPVLSSSTG